MVSEPIPGWPCQDKQGLFTAPGREPGLPPTALQRGQSRQPVPQLEEVAQACRLPISLTSVFLKNKYLGTPAQFTRSENARQAQQSSFTLPGTPPTFTIPEAHSFHLDRHLNYRTHSGLPQTGRDAERGPCTEDCKK